VPQELILYNDNGGTYDCPEDEASMMFLQLVLTETINKVLALFVAGGIGYLKDGVIKKKKEW
jgi:hypothetical protein